MTPQGSSWRREAERGGERARPPLDDRQWAYIQRRFDLTDREWQIAQLVCQGLRNDTVASQLAVRPETVKTHIRNIYRKTGVKNKVLLLLAFIEEAGRGTGQGGEASASS